MIRLGISIEGATEREFVNKVLRPHLSFFGVEATAIDMRGNVSLDKIRSPLLALLGSFERVSTLYDFYGFKGREQRTVAQLETAIRGLVDPERQRRLVPYVQQYEFEALLFAVPEQTVEWMQAQERKLTAMRDVVRRSSGPSKNPCRMSTI